MTTAETQVDSKFVMVHVDDKNTFVERPLQAQTQADAKAEFMGIVRVLDLSRGYIMERESEVIFHSHP